MTTGAIGSSRFGGERLTPTHTRYWCTLCRAGHPEPGSCPAHEDEPLLDLGDEDVWLMLDEQDQRAKWQRLAMIGGVTAGVTIVLTVAAMFALDSAVGWTPNPIRLGAVIALLCSVGGAALFMPKPTVPTMDDPQKDALLALRRAERS